VDDFFARCRLAAMDPRGAALLNRSDAELVALGGRDLSAAAAELAAFPIARAEAGRALPLGEGVNPVWAGRLATLQQTAVEAAWGASKTSLAADEWTALQATLAPYQSWLADRKGGAVEPLGLARVQALLSGGGRAAVEALLARDLAQEAEAAAVAEVARLVHYFRDLHTLLRNFVSFADFYDPGAHAALATPSRLFLAYCECRRQGGERLRVAACFTQGDADFLTVGRNGLFYDRQGRDWDATVVKIVEAPISIRQAFFAPYKKFVRLVEEQAAKLAATKEKEVDARLAATAQTTAHAAAGAPPPVKPDPVDVGKMVGIIAALGVGVGALGALFGGFVSGFLSLEPWWAKLVAVVGMVLAISGPSMAIAWLKLRQRNLGPVLDASGWAVNGRVKVNAKLGAALTALATLPPGAGRSLSDPFEDRAARNRRRLLWVLAAALAAALAWARSQGRWPFGPWPHGP
jgi:hypothetical protein